MWSVLLVSVIEVFILSALWWVRIRGFWNLPDGKHWQWVKLGLVLRGGAMFNKSLIQFLFLFNTILCCVLSLLFDLRPNYGRGNEDNGDSFKRTCAGTVVFSAPDPAAGHTSTGDSCTLIGKSGSVSCGVTAPFSWVLVGTRFCLCSPKECLCSPV